MITIYILKFTDNTHYTGITDNLTRRLSEHRKGLSKYTSRKGLFLLIHKETRSTRIGARNLEIFIKKKGARRYLLSQIC